MDRDDIVYLVVWIILYLVLSVLLNFLAVWLWGVIAVGIFSLPALGFWQMFGLRLLIGIILPSHVSPNNTRRD